MTAPVEVRPEIPRPIPERILKLPVDHRGYPVPWFVANIDGLWDFRVLKPGAIVIATQNDACWVCGERMGRYRTWPVGPMCAVNRNTAEPPSHKECAEWSVRACPFLTRPHMRRREANMPEGTVEPGGVMIRRNPGAIVCWTTVGEPARKCWDRRSHTFHFGDPAEVSWWARGREATRDEVMESIDSGMPILREYAEKEAGGMRALQKEYNRALEYVPAAA